MNKPEKIVGILGGMGPEATVDFMQRLIKLVPAKDDSDHIRCVVDNNPKVPSRMKALIDGDGENPGPCMADMAQRLEKWGASFLVIPCNTAHYYYDYVKNSVNIPVLNILDLTTNYVVKHFPEVTNIGILASNAVQKTKMYEKCFEPYHKNIIFPDKIFQNRLLSLIKDIKKGLCGEEQQQELQVIVDHLITKDANLCIIACTELSVIASTFKSPFVDASQILAMRVIEIIKEEKNN
ncbi:aspartate/glutamate racemase family protein [Desulfovibrio litoralis]|uniref:Aspartate racemase n=1 Tax=Desulfovibrio litoralis DSM 11393 TaxID=1121455 RepID=A0A1M7SMX7_9BACT|nr:amino acid racemase [Desulfovibrio litoralis]SHN59840.1 aspartate racemase [Desulfovibrio litoralis DSM 11393]